jgi:5-methylcytosine-specific restriction endonuclease McrA
MGKKLPYTPNNKIKSALRKLFLCSREHSKAMKDAKYTCARCGAKKSVAKGREIKVECHHKDGVLNWQELYEVIRKYLLCDSENLEVLCVSCHKKETNKEKDDAG